MESRPDMSGSGISQRILYWVPGFVVFKWALAVSAWKSPVSLWGWLASVGSGLLRESAASV